MSEGQLIGLITVFGSLILVTSGLRQLQLGARKTLGMAMIWIAIFAVVALVFGAVQ